MVGGRGEWRGQIDHLGLALREGGGWAFSMVTQGKLKQERDHPLLIEMKPSECLEIVPYTIITTGKEDDYSLVWKVCTRTPMTKKAMGV